MQVTITPAPRVESFDSRRGDSFDLRDGTTGPELSSAQRGITVIRAERFNWVTVGENLDSLTPGSTAGLAIFRPWAPGIQKKRDAFTRAWRYGPVIDFAPVMVGLTDRSDVRMADLLALRSLLGDRSAGVWLFAKTSASRDLLKERIGSCRMHSDPMMFVLVSMIETVDLGLAMDESEESTLLVRTDTVDGARLDDLLAAVNSTPGSTTPNA